MGELIKLRNEGNSFEKLAIILKGQGLGVGNGKSNISDKVINCGYVNEGTKREPNFIYRGTTKGIEDIHISDITKTGKVREQQEPIPEQTQGENVTKVVEVVEHQKEPIQANEGVKTIENKIEQVLSILLQQKEQPEQPESIHEAIGNLEVVERKRKQIYISNELENKLNDFCKGKNVKIADVLEVAIRRIIEM